MQEAQIEVHPILVWLGRAAAEPPLGRRAGDVPPPQPAPSQRDARS